MYIEQKLSWEFLAKKSFWKKFLVRIDSYWITKEIIETLTRKECNFIFDSENFKDFLREVYNEELLKEILFKSIYLNNNIEVLDLLEISNPKIDFSKESNNPTNKKILYEQWTFFKLWIKKSFPILFIFNSNNIEWSKIPQEEVEKIINNKKYRYKIKNEIQEVINSTNAWNYLNEKFIFNEANIKKIYHILTKDLLQETWVTYPRWYKKIINVVWNNETTKPENVVAEIQALLEIVKKRKKEIFALKLAFDFHLKYEQIHPFENWNGRTWRFFMNKILIQYWFLPMIVFKENSKWYSSSINSCNTWNKKKYYKFMIEQYKKTLDKCYDFKI